MLGDLQRHTFFVKYTFSKRQYFSPELQIALVRQLHRVWENCFITLLHLTYTKSLSGRSNIQITALWRLWFLWKHLLKVLFFDLDEEWKTFEISEDLQPKIVPTEGIAASLWELTKWQSKTFPFPHANRVFPVHFCKSEQSWISSSKWK